MITFVNYARARGGAEPAAGRFSFCDSGWRRRAQRATGSTSPPAACTGKLMARVDHFCELRARARRSRARRRPIFFLRIRLAAQRVDSAAAPSAASYGVDVAAGGLHRQADGSRPCARSEISAVPFIRWRYGAERRAGLLFGLGLGRGRRATGQDRRRPLAPGGSRAPKIASALNLHPKGPALITFVNYARARGGAEPAAGRFSFCESGWRRRVSTARRAQRATGSTSPPAACTGKLMARVDHFCELRARARRSRARRRPIFFLRIRLAAPRAQRATGSTSPPAACTGKLMGLGRVLAPRFQPCPLSVGGTAPSAALAYFLALALALAVAVELRVRIAAGRSHQEGLALRKSRVH